MRPACRPTWVFHFVSLVLEIGSAINLLSVTQEDAGVSAELNLECVSSVFIPKTYNNTALIDYIVGNHCRS